MSETKKLGRGLKDISHLFLSASEKSVHAEDILITEKETESAVLEIPAKSVCLVGDGDLSFQDAFFVINLSLALTRLDYRVAVVDVDDQLPYLNFFLDFKSGSCDISKTDLLVKESPQGVKFIGLNAYPLENVYNGEHKKRIIDQLIKIESEADLILFSVIRKNLLNVRHLLRGSLSDFLMLIPPDKDKMLNFYKLMKKIFLENPLAKIGIVVTNIDHMYEINAVYNKTSQVVKKFLDKELYKYGFLFKIKQGVESKNTIGHSFDSDFNESISKIAQILVSRLKVAERNG